MKEPRDKPYIWVTWLSPLLAGNSSCQFAAWFKAHWKGYEKQPSDFNSAAWNERHTTLLNEAQEWARAFKNYVTHEREKDIVVFGKYATVGGMIDLLVELTDCYLVIDAKGGQVKDKDVSQVKLYMYLLGLIKGVSGELLFADKPIKGVVYYASHNTPIPTSAIDQSFISRVNEQIRLTARPDPLPKDPSPRECKFCDITIADCPDRAGEGGKLWTETEAF